MTVRPFSRSRVYYHLTVKRLLSTFSEYYLARAQPRFNCCCGGGGGGGGSEFRIEGEARQKALKGSGEELGISNFKSLNLVYS